ncbi:MAG: TlpA disulfide reductase family protein [Mariprofundaceae bacterium]
MIDKTHRQYRIAIATILYLLLLVSCSNERVQAVVKGSTFPAVQLHTLSGDMVSSKILFADKVVVFNVWATWCPPCVKEMPDLVQLSKLLSDEKFMVVSLAVDNSIEDVRQFVKERNISFPVFWDQGGKNIASEKLRTFKYPETFIINRNGSIVEKVIGAFPWADPEVVKMLDEIYETGRVPPNS